MLCTECCQVWRCLCFHSFNLAVWQHQSLRKTNHFATNFEFLQVVLDSNNEIVGYGSGHMLSIWDSPIFCPIYADNDHVFVAIFSALADHFKENIQRKNLIDMRVPTNHMENIEAALRGIADVQVVSFLVLENYNLGQLGPSVAYLHHANSNFCDFLFAPRDHAIFPIL